MGTSASFGGSAGQGWTNARRAAGRLGGAPTAANARRAAAAAADALAGWEDLPADARDETARPSTSPQPATPPRLIYPLPAVALLGLPPLRSLGKMPSAGVGGGGSRRGGGGGGGGRGAGRIRTGRSRSPRRAASAAARIAYAGYAAREGDATALAAIGIDIADLTGRTPSQQCNVILNAILDLPRALQEQELRAASASTLIQLLTEDAALPPNDVVRIFVSNYLIEIMTVEQSATLRENGDGIAAERILRQTVDAVVAREVARLGNQVSANDLERVIGDTLERARTILAAG